MDETDKARLIALATLPLASLSLVDVGFLAGVIGDHPDEVVALIPDLAPLLDL